MTQEMGFYDAVLEHSYACYRLSVATKSQGAHHDLRGFESLRHILHGPLRESLETSGLRHQDEQVRMATLVAPEIKVSRTGEVGEKTRKSGRQLLGY